MIKILYQDKVLTAIDKFTITTFPHTVLIQGEEGSGKTLICEYISNKFECPLINLTESLNMETIMDIYTSSVVQFYLIEADKISVKDQNVILKFLEEPCDNVFILITNSYNTLLDTVKNRCYIITLSRYTKDQLQVITGLPETNIALDIFHTPGGILTAVNLDITSMLEYAQKIFDHIKTANLSNCLTISNKIAFKDSETGYPIQIFVAILLYLSGKSFNNFYVLTSNLFTDLHIPNINKRYLFENYLISLKYEH